jgi:chromosome segregation ATPase
MNWEIFAALGMVAVSVGSLIAGLYTARGSVRKSDIESLSAIIDDLKADNERLKKRLGEVETENANMKKSMLALEDQIKEKDQCIEDLRGELNRAIAGRQDRENRIADLERKVEQLEGKA